MSQPQTLAEKGVPPVTSSNPPGADYGINTIRPKTSPNANDMDDATLNMDNYEGSGEKPSYMGLRGDNLIWGVTFFATMGFSLFGYDQGLMSGIISSRQFNTEFPQTYQNGPDDVHGGTIQGTVVAVYEVGAFAGAILSFFIGNYLGRLKMMFYGAIFMIVGTIIACTAMGPHFGFGQFIIARVISGVGTGMLTATIPSWVAECSKAHNRGFLICSEASTVAIGTLIAYWINYGCSRVQTSFSWRFPTALQAFFAAFVIWGALVMPQSPRWLVANGHDKEALKVVAALAGTTQDHPRALHQYHAMLESHQAATMQKASSKDLLAQGKKQNFRRMVIGASSQVHQQLGGCNAVIYYATILFENQIRLDRDLSLILGGVLAAVYAIFAILSFFIVERIGRRPLFLIGTAGQGLSMYIVWACLLAAGRGNAKPANPDPEIAKGAAVGLYLFIAFFGATLLPLPWLYPAELNAQSVRTQANAISTMCNWLFNFLVVQVLPTMTASLGGWTFFIFAIENTIALPLIWLFYPETGGRELSEIDIVFARAYLANRRPTLIADEMPELTEYQQEKMLEQYDIHGATDAEAEGVTRENVDLDLPPAEDPSKGEKGRTHSNSDDGTMNEQATRI